MKVLVTGADGFVGRHLVPHLAQHGHRIRAGVRPDAASTRFETTDAVEVVPLELLDDASVRRAIDESCDAVVHLAAVASNAEATRDAGRAWDVNASGTARVATACGAHHERGRPIRLLVISSGEVYGRADRALSEVDVANPQTPYAASKVGAEVAALEVWRRTGLPVTIARPFTHSGPGQQGGFLLPSWIRRLREAGRSGAREIPVGNLAPVRDITDVRDVANAYRLLLEHGGAGETYNVARGEGIALGALFERLATLMGVVARAVPDASLIRRVDLPFLVGDSSRLRAATGWTPAFSIDRMLQDMLDAQAD